MSYLTVKKVKGHYYAYRQESFREGGKVRTRTIEYLGAVDSALARSIKSGSISNFPNNTVTDVITITVSPEEGVDTTQTNTSKLKPANKSETNPASRWTEDQIQMNINGEMVVVDRHSGEVLKQFGSVITTENESDLSRPFSQSLILPKLENYSVSTTAIRRTHARYGQRLVELKINPSHMSDVKIEYGHPDGFRANKDGSYSVVVSRRSQNKRHPVNKVKLWKNYRQALSHSFIDAIEIGHPRLYDDMRLVFDYHYRESQGLALESIYLSSDPLTKIVLSLQLKLWGKLPVWVKENVSTEELGQISLSRQTGWRDEAAGVLAEVQKSGWEGMDKRLRDTRAKLKSRITKRSNILKDASMFESLSHRLSGKRRKLLREMIESENKLRAVEELNHRIVFLKKHLPH